MKTWIGILTAAVAFLGIGYLNLYCSGMKFNDNSAGVVISALGVLVTALVGWQIYNAIEMRSIIREYDKLKRQLEESSKALKMQDEQNLTLIEAYAKVNNATNGSYSFANQYEMYLESLELFLKANVPLRYKTIVEINAILDMTLTSLKWGIITDKRQFVEREKNFDELYLNILSHLHRREDNIKQLSSRLTSIHDKRIAICQKIKDEIKSLDPKTKQESKGNNVPSVDSNTNQ